MATQTEIELQATALAHQDALSAVIACLANSGSLNPVMCKEALSAIKDLNSQTQGALHKHHIYDAHMQLFVAAAEKRL